LGVLSAGNDQRLRAEIEVGGVVIGLFDGSKDFIAQAEVQGEAWTHFEVVESINGVNLPVIDGVGGHTGDGSAVGNAEQESGDGLAVAFAGSGGIVCEVAAEAHGATRRSRLEDRELFEAEFAAELQGMASADPA